MKVLYNSPNIETRDERQRETGVDDIVLESLHLEAWASITNAHNLWWHAMFLWLNTVPLSEAIRAYTLVLRIKLRQR